MLVMLNVELFPGHVEKHNFSLPCLGWTWNLKNKTHLTKIIPQTVVWYSWCCHPVKFSCNGKLTKKNHHPIVKWKIQAFTKWQGALSYINPFTKITLHSGLSLYVRPASKTTQPFAHSYSCYDTKQTQQCVTVSHPEAFCPTFRHLM